MPSIQNAYTDADVQAATAELVEAPLENSEAQDVRLILDTVAPAIAARALREFATYMESPEWTHRDDWGMQCAYAFEVVKRADEIESGAS